jgi:hypothetical protein
MKIGLIYNVYDGEELLEGSIRQLYNHVYKVIAVYQTNSNWGEVYEGGKNEVLTLQRMGLIDEAIAFEPNITNERLNGCNNELQKRKLGFEKAKEMGCSHYLFMDCDEYYNANDFLNAIKAIQHHNFKATVCQIQAYEKFPTLAKRQLEGYYVPFIHEIESTRAIGFQKYPYYCDPTRTTGHSFAHLFPKEQIVMHHFTSIRADIERKYRNSSAKINFNLSEMLQTYAQLENKSTETHKLVANKFAIDVSKILQPIPSGSTTGQAG